MKQYIRNLLIALLAACLGSCGNLDDKSAREAVVRQIAADVGNGVQVEVIEMRRGEGDADNVYFLVDLRLTTLKNAEIAHGALTGIVLYAARPTVINGVTVLFQKQHSEQWKLTKYWQEKE